MPGTGRTVAYFLGAGMTFARIDPGAAGAEPRSPTPPAPSGLRSIRVRATIGGNLATASPAGDSIPVLAAYDSQVVVASARAGTRHVRWNDFLVGAKRTSLAADELIVGVEFDAPPGHGSFAKVGPRNAMVIAVAGVCLQLDEERRSVRVALGSVGPTVLRAGEAEAYGATLVPWDDPAAAPTSDEFHEFGRLAAVGASPIDDLRGSSAYRRHVIDHLSRRALGWTIEDRRAA